LPGGSPSGFFFHNQPDISGDFCMQSTKKTSWFTIFAKATSRRDSEALQVKLDELIRSIDGAAGPERT